MDLFDYKPTLDKLAGRELPGSIRMGQRITGMTSGQSSFPVARSIFKFKQHGQSGAWASELIPHTAKIVDDIAIIKSMNTDAINHDPAITFIQSGSQQPGRASMGAWGKLWARQRESESARVRCDAVAGAGAQSRSAAVLAAVGQRLPAVEPSGRAVPRGVEPRAVPQQSRRHRRQHAPRHARRRRQAQSPALRPVRRSRDRDPASRSTRWRYRMQTSVPDLLDLSKEPQHIFDLYGPDCRKPGTYASNCLLARRAARARRAIRAALPSRLGPAQRPAARSRTAMPRHRPGIRGARDGTSSSAACSTTRWWSGGGGIRPHRVLPGQAHRDQLRPRPSPALLHHVDGGRRRQAWLQLRRDRRLLLQRGREPGPRARSAGDDSASAGHRSQAPDVQVSGPPISASPTSMGTW